MYGRLQQQNLHSQAQNYHVRPPETTLFEDSPKSKISNLHDMSYPRNQERLNKLHQSEESGGVQHTNEDGGDHDSDDNPEGENDIEYIIMNLYSKMKNLENKYIDLANFYKQELVKSSSSKQIEGVHDRIIYGQEMRSNAISPSRSFDRSPDQDLDQSPGKRNMPQEREIIKDLIEEKKRLEEDMKQMIQLKTGSYYQTQSQQQQQQQQSPHRKHLDYQQQMQTPEQVLALKQQLQNALSGVLENIEQTQKNQLQVLTQKQNEMHQLASKNNLPIQLRNDSISLWYDAKSKLSQQMSDLKSQIQSKQMAASPGGQGIRADNQQQVFESFRECQIASTKFADDLEKELIKFRRKTEYLSINVQKFKSSLKYKAADLRDDQTQIQSVLRDIYKNIQQLESRDFLLLSGEKQQNSQMLSPFEKRLVNYQKSAEMRKESSNPLNRSGSRGRQGVPTLTNTGSNFYKGDFQNNQTNLVGGNATTDSEQDSLMIKSKFKHLQRLIENYNNKANIVVQEQKEVDKIVEDTFQDQAKFLKTTESLLNSLNRENLKYNAYSKTKVNPKSPAANYLPISPKYNQNSKYDAPSSNYNSVPKQNQQEQKLADLQKHNDQLFSQLRQANEKYLDERVQTNKLAGELKHLQKSFDDVQSQLRKLQQDPIIKQQIRKNSQHRNDYSQPRVQQSSYNSATTPKENEELRKRIQELEKECLTLTYYNQDVQRLGSINQDPYVRQLQQENQEGNQNFRQICLSVQEFLMSMRRLQRAVNNKDKDIGVYKSDFERVKKILEKFIQETKEQQENKVSQGHQTFVQARQNSSMVGFGGSSSNNQSMVLPHDKRDTRFMQENSVGGLRNKSQVPGQNKSNRALQPPMYPITQRPEPNSLDHYAHGNKKGVITAKQNNFMQSPSPQIYEQNVNKFEDQQSPSQEQKFNRLIEEIRETEEQSERQRHQIEELKSVNEILLAEKNAAEIKSNSKTLNIQKLNQNLKLGLDNVKQYEKLVNDYKDGLIQLEQHQNLNKQAVIKIKTELLMRERDLFNGTIPKHSQSSSAIRVQEQQSPQVSQNLINQLRDELTKQIRQKEQDFEQVIGEINGRLQSKEQDLARVKKLFVDKLRELESSFNEISQDMLDSEQIQQETTKRYHQQLTKQTSQNFQNQQKSELEKSIDNIIGKVDDEQREEDLDKLIEANEELLEQNSQLRQKINQLEKDGANQEDLKALKEEVSILKEDNDELDQLVKQLREDEFNVQKQLDQLKIEHKRLQGSVQEITKQKEQLHQELQGEINAQHDELQNNIKTLQQEQEQRVFFQSQSKNIEKQLKVMRNDKSALQNENERLIKSEQELLNQVEQIKQEQEYMSHLRRDRNDDSFDDRNNEEEDSLFVDDQENEKIQANPVEVAKSYYRMLKATKKEYLILSKAHDKVSEKHQELKNQVKEMKQEFRDDAENNINRESRLFDLENSNLRLTQELESVKGDYVVEEQAIREEIDIQFRERLAFKDAEVESMTSKLARVSQTNSEMTTKILRLESNINELSAENESMKVKISSLEMELEMTKSNGDRDTEQLMEQQKQRDELQKAITQSDRAKEQSKITEQLRQIENQKQVLEAKLNEKEEKLKAIAKEKEQQKMSDKLIEGIRLGLESKVQDIQKELEAEKQLRQESEELRYQQIQEQEEKRLQLIEQQKIENKKLQGEYKLNIQQEKIKQQDVDKLREQFENDLKKKHEEEKALLEKRLKEDREQQESRLLESEKEKIDRMRKEMQEEKELQLQEKVAEEKQKANNELEKLRLRLENEKIQELQQLEEEANLATQMQEEQRKMLEDKIQLAIEQMESEKQTNIQKLKKQENEQLLQLQNVKGELKANQESSLKSIRGLKLVQALQKFARDAILKELENAKEEKELKAIQDHAEFQKLREDFEEQVTQLGELNEKQLMLVEQNLKAESEELKKEKKQLKLVQVLQSKARESILAQLEKEKISKELQRNQDLLEIQRLKDLHEQENLDAIQQNTLRIQALEQRLINQNQQAELQQKQMRLCQALLIASRKSILNDYKTQQDEQEEQKIQDLEKLEKLQSDHANKLLQLNEVNLNKISLYEQKLHHDQELAKREKKSLLLVKVLQSKARQSILDELQQEKLARQNEKQKITDKLNKIQEDHQKQVNDMQSQNKSEQQKLQLIEASKIEQQKSIKAFRLVQALQLQARKAILKQLEDVKVQKDKSEELAKLNYQSLTSLKQKEQQNNEQQLSKLHQQIKEMEANNQEELDLVRDEHQEEINHLNQELNKVRKEQEDLIHSLSQQQDQQTQDLLNQKDNEARYLVDEMAHKHQLDIQEKDKQNRLLQSVNEKVKMELEEQIQALILEKEEIAAQFEQDMQDLNQDQEEQLEQVKLQDQEELEKLRITYEEENLQNQKVLLVMEEQLETTKEHQRQMLQKFSESKQEEIEAFKTQIHNLQLQNEQLQQKQEADQESLLQQIQTKSNQHSEAIFILQNDHKVTLEKLSLEKEEVLKEHKNVQEQVQTQLQHQNEQMLDQLKNKLQKEHQDEIAKKGAEKTMFESIQSKMREELQHQIQISEKQKQEQLEKVQNLQKEIQKREMLQQAETISQQEHIDSLNQIINIANSSQEELQNEKLKLIATLDSLKKQQSESENKVQQDLRTKVDTLTSLNEKLKAEIKIKEDELVDVKSKLKQSQKDIENLEKDMDQFVKEMDEERAQNELSKEKINTQLQQLTEQINTKQAEHHHTLQVQKEQDKLQLQKLQAEIASLKTTHDQEILTLNEQNTKLLADTNKAVKSNESFINDSIEHIQTKIGEFDVEIGKIKKLEKQLDSQKQLNKSLTNDALNDNDEDIIKLVGNSDTLRYIKRIKYMEKAWILITQSSKYYWIDQDNIPVQKLQNLQFDSVEDLTVKLQDQLDQLELEKEKILKLVNDRSARKQYLGSQNENESLKQELSEIQLANNTLQQNNLQLKHKINELNEMIFGLADTDKDHENMKKIVDLHKKSEELIKKLHLQIEETKKFEDEVEEKQTEIDALKKQISDQDYSFAKGGKSFGQGNKPDNFPLEASSIGRDPDEESFNHINVVDAAQEPVQQKVKRLEQEAEDFQRLQRELENSNRTLQVELKEVKASANSVLSGQHNNEAEMQDHLKHTRSILIKFLEKVTITSKENEDLLPIVYSMMLFTKEEMNGLMAIRQASADKLVKEQAKKGVFNMFGNKKDKK